MWLEEAWRAEVSEPLFRDKQESGLTADAGGSSGSWLTYCRFGFWVPGNFRASHTLQCHRAELIQGVQRLQVFSLTSPQLQEIKSFQTQDHPGATPRHPHAVPWVSLSRWLLLLNNWIWHKKSMHSPGQDSPAAHSSCSHPLST